MNDTEKLKNHTLLTCPDLLQKIFKSMETREYTEETVAVVTYHFASVNIPNNINRENVDFHDLTDELESIVYKQMTDKIRKELDNLLPEGMIFQYSNGHWSYGVTRGNKKFYTNSTRAYSYISAMKTAIKELKK